LGILASAPHASSNVTSWSAPQLDLAPQHEHHSCWVFGDTLSKRITRELHPNGVRRRKLAETDWQSLSPGGRR